VSAASLAVVSPALVGVLRQRAALAWFAGRVDFSPTVDHRTAAAMVYKRREQVINVFVWPRAGGSPSHVTRSDARGYHVISWTRDGVAAWIVSDLALVELDDFARKLDAASHE
jgi:anti-sigma factor RsiW